MRRLGSRRLGAVLCVAVLGLTACTGAGGGDTSPTATATGTTGGPAEPSSTGTTTTDADVTDGTTTAAAGPGPDCEGLAEARERLLDATEEELARLGIDRSDPRAFSVQVIVTGQRAAEYWATVRDELSDAEPAVRADADTVVGYWEPLDAALEEIEIPDGSESSIAAANERYQEISAQHPDAEIVPAQERLRTHIDDLCGDAPTP